MTFTEADAERISRGGLEYGESNSAQLLLMAINGKVQPVVTMVSADWGKYIYNKNCIIRFQKHIGNCKMSMISCQDVAILRTLRITTVDNLAAESVADFAEYAPFVVGELPPNNWDQEVPCWLMWSTMNSESLVGHLLRNSTEFVHIHVTRTESMGLWANIERISMTEDDWRLFETSQLRVYSRRVEDLEQWATNTLQQGNTTTIVLNDAENIGQEGWNLMTRLMEMSSPGRSVYLSRMLGVRDDMEWPSNVAKKLSEATADGYWRSIEPRDQTLTSIVSRSDTPVRYDNIPARLNQVSRRAVRSMNGGATAPAADKEMLKTMLSHALEQVEDMKKEMTGLTRTATLMHERNVNLQRDYNKVRRELSDEQRARLEMNTTPGVDEAFIGKVVRQVLMETGKDGKMPELTEDEDEAANNNTDGGFMGGRIVKEVNSREEEDMFRKAEEKLRMISQRARTKHLELTQGGARATSTPIEWGTCQGETRAPALWMSGQETQPLIQRLVPCFREPAEDTQQAAASRKRKLDMEGLAGARQLARAGAMKPRLSAGDSEEECRPDRDVLRTEDVYKTPKASTSGKKPQAKVEPEKEKNPSRTLSLGEEDVDLVLHIAEDELDFEPDPPASILDDTQVLNLHKMLRFCNRSPLRRSPPVDSEEAKNTTVAIEMEKEKALAQCIYFISTIPYYLYHIYTDVGRPIAPEMNRLYPVLRILCQ